MTALFWWAKGRRPLGPPNTCAFGNYNLHISMNTNEQSLSVQHHTSYIESERICRGTLFHIDLLNSSTLFTKKALDHGTQKYRVGVQRVPPCVANRALAPCQNLVVWTKTVMNVHSTHQNQDLSSSDPRNNQNAENVGCDSGKRPGETGENPPSIVSPGGRCRARGLSEKGPFLKVLFRDSRDAMFHDIM